MSIKDLFKKTVSIENTSTGSTDVESHDYIIEKIRRRDTFIPDIDFASASNFARYGSAYEYYTKAITRIYNDYPYDGSKKEKIIFELSSSYLDKYVFDKRYPKTTGHIDFSHGGWGTAASIINGYGIPNASADYEYIFSRGGMHTASAGMIGKRLVDVFDKSIIYNTSSNRQTTYDINLKRGLTIEFWLKKQSFDISKTEKEIILDLWNGKAVTSAEYGRVTLALTSSATAGAGANLPFRITVQSGTIGAYEVQIGSTNITTGSLQNWAHYAVSLVSGASGIVSRLYKNGDLDQKKTVASAGFDNIGGVVNGYIGALQTSPSGSTAAQFAGKLSASLDDFRFWKTRRTSEQIYRNWYRHVGGGTNTDEANTFLGVYYKFNEGIVGSASIDANVLDYSGRIANGSWTGYSVGARSENSAFVESGLLASEEQDPIIYSSHPKVSRLLSELQASGSLWDQFNPTNLYNTTVPSWIREEDEDIGKNNVKFLYQIIASHFDTLHAQVGALVDLKTKVYPSASAKPLPFADKLITERGMVAPDLFINSNILERYEDTDFNKVLYEKEISDIKNLIYTNVYNNLETIYKSKGTEKGIRNLLRCFGIDDEIVKLNIYTDRGTHYFNDNYMQSSTHSKFINFNSSSNYNATVYQTGSSTNTRTYISGSGTQKLEKNSAFTLESNVMFSEFRKRFKTGNVPDNYPFIDLSSSVFGFHEALEDSSNYTWVANEIANLQVFAVRERPESNDVKFVLKNRDGTINLESKFYADVYENQNWNFAIRVKPDIYPLFGNAAVTSNPNYTVELYGVTHAYDNVKDQFILSASLSYASGSSYLSNRKRIFAGAHRTNFTGSTVQRTDVQIGGVRFYLDYLDNSIIRQHNIDLNNYGTFKSGRSATIFTNGAQNVHIPSADLLVLNWNFDTVTTSNALGTFIVDDVSSGSSDQRYGWVDNIIRREHKAKGQFFPTINTDIVENRFLYNSSKELPEISMTSNNIFIKQDNDQHVIKDDDVSDNFYSLEKSMYQVISKEMLNTFSSVKEFSNLMGQATDRYRMEYKDLNLLRRLFFEKNSGSLDFDRFTEYFKWIDTSISTMVKGLFPIGARYSKDILDTVESHILERNKYQNKLPLLKYLDIPETKLRGAEEREYNWKTGHAPIGGGENDNCLWQRERKKRTDIAAREDLRKIMVYEVTGSQPTFAQSNRQTYAGSAYAIRSLSRPYVFKQGIEKTIHGGTNYSLNKDRNIIHNYVMRHGPTSSVGVPVNVVTIGEGTGQGIVDQEVCNDVTDPNAKKTYCIHGEVGRFSNGEIIPKASNDGVDIYADIKQNKLPINIVSASIQGGYHDIITTKYKANTDFANIHSDTTDYTNEIPMQGVFTQNWVGGHQHRHVDLNKFDSTLNNDDSGGPTLNNLQNEYTRPEAWQILFDEYQATSSVATDGAFGFVGADYGGPYPDPARKYAVLYRDEHAKRPVNIKNIKTVTGSGGLFDHGNYRFGYEKLHVFGKTGNNFNFRKSPAISNYLTPYISDRLPQTTNTISLLGVEPQILSGNVHGLTFSTMKPDNNAITRIIGFSSSFHGGTASAGGFSAKGFNVVGWAGGTGSGNANFRFDRIAAVSVPDPINFFIITGSGAFTETQTNRYILTGSGVSNHNTYWNNIRTKVSNSLSASYTVAISSYSTSSYSKGIVWKPSDHTHHSDMKAVVTTSGPWSQLRSAMPGGADPNHFAFSCWLNLSTGSDGNYSYKGKRRTLFSVTNDGYSEPGTGSTEACREQIVAELAITGANGDLTYFEYVTKQNAGGCICIRTASYGSYESNFSGSGWKHIAINRNGSTGIKWYADGQPVPGAQAAQTMTDHAGMSCSEGQFISASNVHLLNNTGALAHPTHNVGGLDQSIFFGQIDEVCFFSGTLQPEAFNRLYDFGYKLNVTGCYMDDLQPNRIAWFEFHQATPSNNLVVLDSMGLGNHLTCSIGTDEVSSSLVNSVLEEPFANFTITAKEFGAVYNANLSAIAPACDNSWFNFSNVDGGASPDEQSNPVTSSIPFIDIVTGVPCGDCKTESVIINRFSAPGSPEASSIGYLDVYNREYSVYNALPFRNLTVRGSGSGESYGIIRTNDHLNRRNGLQTHLRRHSGKFGHDIIHGVGTITAANYVTVPSFQKIQRNTKNRPNSTSTIASPSFNKVYDNGYVSTPIPASDFQYSWVTQSLGKDYSVESGQQNLYGYSTKDGLFEKKISKAIGNVTFTGVPSDGDVLFITDGENSSRFKFVTNFSTASDCPPNHDPLRGCHITNVKIGGSAAATATFFHAALTSSTLQFTSNRIGVKVHLTSSYIDERFNNPMTVIPSSAPIGVIGMFGSKVDIIPAITFPSQASLSGDYNG